MRLVVFKKSGEAGEVAINPAQVTHVRTGSSAYTDVYYGQQRVAVVGTFEHVVARLSGELEGEGGEARPPGARPIG